MVLCVCGGEVGAFAQVVPWLQEGEKKRWAPSTPCALTFDQPPSSQAHVLPLHSTRIGISSPFICIPLFLGTVGCSFSHLLSGDHSSICFLSFKVVEIICLLGFPLLFPFWGYAFLIFLLLFSKSLERKSQFVTLNWIAYYLLTGQTSLRFPSTFWKVVWTLCPGSYRSPLPD